MPLSFLEQLSHIIILAGIVQGPFVALILNRRSASRSRANTFLSVLLLAFSFTIAHILFAGAVINHYSAQIHSLGDPTYYLIAPLLWFYTSELTGHPVKWSWRLLLHFSPFLLIVLFSTSFPHLESGSLIGYLSRHPRLVTIFFWTTVFGQFSVYQVLVRRQWVSYQKFVQQEVSNKEGIDISWVQFYMIVFALINVFFLFGLFAVIHLQSGAWLPQTTALIFSLSVFALGYKGILQRELVTKSEDKNRDEAVNPSPTLSEKPDEQLLEKLRRYMEEKKPYLNPELTLSGLATDLEMSRSQLSQLINAGTGDNFYDFVNKFRVEEVKRLMVDPKVANYSLLGLALEAGFKSKSTFNLIFKRFTGLTPTQYRKNISA